MTDKTTENLERWCSGQGIDFMDDQAEAAYKERARRIADVIQLKVPDRVPELRHVPISGQRAHL